MLRAAGGVRRRRDCAGGRERHGAGFDVLDLLVAKGLLVRRRTHRARTRLVMLETIRAYAAERLAATGTASDSRASLQLLLAFAAHHGADRALWGAGRQRAPCPARWRQRQPSRRAGWAVSQERAELALAIVRRARQLLADARSLFRRSRVGRPGAATATAPTRIPRCTSTFSAPRPGPWPLGRHAEQARSWQAEALARALANHGPSRERCRPVPRRRPPGRVESRGARRGGARLGERGRRPRRRSRWQPHARARPRPRRRAARACPPAASLLEASATHHLANLFRIGDLPRAAPAAIATQRSSPTVRSRSRAKSTVPTRGCSSKATSGWPGCSSGDTEAARRRSVRTELCRELVVLPVAAEGMAGLAAVAAIRDDRERAARLVGAAAAHRYDTGGPGRRPARTPPFSNPLDAGADAWDAPSAKEPR